MSTGLVIIVVVVVLVVGLAAGGAIAQRRRMERNTDAFARELETVNRDLAAARAQDRGWERDTLEAAALAAWEAERPGSGTPELTLVRVLDRPGTDEDQAVFRAGAGEELTLGRQDGVWVLESLR